MATERVIPEGSIIGEARLYTQTHEVRLPRHAMGISIGDNVVIGIEQTSPFSASIHVHAPRGVNVIRARRSEDTIVRPTQDSDRLSVLSLKLIAGAWGEAIPPMAEDYEEFLDEGGVPERRLFVGQSCTIAFEGIDRVRSSSESEIFVVETMDRDTNVRILLTQEDLAQALGKAEASLR